MPRARPRPTQRALAAVLAAACAAVSGCGGSGGSGGTTSDFGSGRLPFGTPTGVLATVADSPAARRYLEWSAVNEVGRLGRRWLHVYGIGTGMLGPAALPLAQRTHINALTATSAVMIGQPPNTAVRLSGAAVDASAVSTALTKLGARKISAAGHTFLAFGAEHSINPTGPLMQIGILNELDRVIVSGHTLAAGSAQAPVLAVLGGQPSLLNVPIYRAAAACLGNTITATIAAPSAGQTPAGVQLIAIGDARPSGPSAPITEVLCAVGGSGTQVGAEVSAVTRGLGPNATLPQSSTPTRIAVQSVTAHRADADGQSVMQAIITWRATAPAGLLYQMLQRNAIGQLLGRG